MKTYLTFLLVLTISLGSCIDKESKKDDTVTSKAEVETNKQFNKINVPEQYIENDSLLSLLFSDLEKITLNPKFAILTEPEVNTHNESIIDSIRTFSFEKTKIYFYQATTWESIYAATIENSDFIFLDFIYIGVTKKTFKNTIKTEIESDLVKIGNLEQTSVFTFMFKNNILRTIEYEGYID